MTDLIFDVPWWLVALLLIAAVGLFVSGNRRPEGRLKYAAAGVAVLAGVLLLVSYLVETDREQVERRTRELVEAAEQGDWGRFGSLLHPDVEFAIYSGRAELVSGAEQAADEIGLRTVRVSSLAAEPTNGLITSMLTVRSEQEVWLDFPITSEWRLDWLKEEDQWLLRRVTLLRLGQREGGAWHEELPRP